MQIVNMDMQWLKARQLYTKDNHNQNLKEVNELSKEDNQEVMELQCRTCGRIFIGRKNQRYCGEGCRNAWYRGGKAHVTEYQRNNPLSREAVAAVQQGLSYGQAQARKLAATVRITRK